MIELTLTHDGGRWVATSELLAAAAPTLEALDLEVRRALSQLGHLKAGETVQVHMAFDNSTIPQWIRQYAQHYFNRVVDLAG